MALPRKSIAAVGVLAVGLAAAWLFFRRGASETEQTAPPTTDRLVINAPVSATPPWAKSSASADAQAASDQPPWLKDKPATAPQRPTELTDNGPQAHLGTPQPLPAAAPPQPNTASNGPSRFGQPFSSTAPPPDAIKDFDGSQTDRPAPVAIAGLPTTMDGDRTAAPRIHRIVDGDTLGLLAQRYLGNTQRQNEIYEANRDRLKDPELLPIGVELRIPSDSPPPPLRPVPTNPIRSPGV